MWNSVDYDPTCNIGPNGDDKISRLESRIENLEINMNQVKEMLGEVLARLQ